MQDIKQLLKNKYLRVTSARSGGPGGQHVNKVNTRVTLWFNLAECRELSTEQKLRIREVLATRCDKRGYIRIVSQRYRTQQANRRAAFEKLCELVKNALAVPHVRIKTRIPSSSKEKRLTEKRKRSRIKKQRAIKHQFTEGD